MKIMQVIPELQMGGAERFCEELTYTLMALGHQVLVVSLYSTETVLSKRMESAGVQMRYLGKKGGLDGSCLRRLRSHIRAFEPDAIHAHQYALKYAVLASVGMRRRVVYTVHTLAGKETDRPLNRVLFACGGAVPVSLSEEVRRTVIAQYHLPEERCPVIYNGIPLERCMPVEDYGAGKPMRVVHVGRFAQVKNHRCIVEAAKLLPRGQFHFLFLGEGELLPEIRDMVSAAGLADAFTFFGLSDNVYPHLRESDVFILPSLWEGMPITIIEAMGTGLPIVASDVGGIRDMIEDNVNGLLIEPEPRALADALRRLAADVSLRERLGKSALAASERFSIEATARAYIKLYEGLI